MRHKENDRKKSQSDRSRRGWFLGAAAILTCGLQAAALPISKAVVTSTTPAVAQDSDSVVVQALSRELSGSLSSDQIAAIENIEAEQFQAQLYRTGLRLGEKEVSLLVCVSGKAVLLVKGRVGVCSTLGGEIYHLLGYGGGIGAGVQVSVFGIGIITPQGQAIAGTYGAATTVAQGGLGYLVKGMFGSSAWRIQLHGLLRFLLAFGGPEFAVAHAPDSLFVMAGIGIGPLFDVGLEWFRVIPKP
jgi:hypothetical protein